MLLTAVLGYPAAMVRMLLAVAHGLRSLLGSQLGLAIENAALRQYLAVVKQDHWRHKPPTQPDE